MPLTPGTRLGVFALIEPIGRGGMGEVYRARDTKLDRDVAIKVLPEAFAHDADRLARFLREARTLASLNHPNIAIIHGLEQAGDIHALVMELIEGEDLSQRIARGAMPIDDALPIAKQIADALEAAHEQHIIHRDLKLANIRVRPDGTVKVLDFGLAKAVGPPEGGHYVQNGRSVRPQPDLTDAPTITSPALITGAGVILGTAAYMSPEQAKGREADKRSDIWAFGCVLFEMLSGTRAFPGDDVSEVLASVLAREPEWSALPATVPASIRALLRRCLEKDRRKRVGDIAAALFTLDEHATLAGSAGSITQDPAYVQTQVDAAVSAAVASTRTALQRSARRRLVSVAGAVGVVVAGLAVAAVWYVTRPAPSRVVRTEIATAGAAALSIQVGDRTLAITPDGSRIVYRGNNQILVRALDQLAPTALTGLGAPRGLFVSPDGQWVGFFDGGTLKKVAITGGSPVTVTAVLLGTGPRGATWGEDDTIVFATVGPDVGLLRVPAAGGDPTVLTKSNREAGESDHLWPEFLPGGKAVLFTIWPLTGGLGNAQVAVLDLQTGTQTVLVRGGHHAHYVPTGPGSPKRPWSEGGHLVYGAAGTLRAVAFDPVRLAVVGTAVPVIEDVATTQNGGVDAVVATNGTLAYVSGDTEREGVRRRLVWMDRQGREEPISGAPAHAFTYPRLSPDGTRVALDIRDQDSDIWIWSLQQQTLTRLTFDPAPDVSPVWTPDGRRLVWASRRAGPLNLYWQAADGTGTAERLTTSPNEQRASGVTPDGRRLVFFEDASAGAGAPQDLAMLSLEGDRQPTRLLQTTFAERNGEVSPDGRWLAYESNESGTFEIYVRPFPAVDTGRWQVSTGGGRQPLWARSGRELFYWGADGALMGAPVQTAPGSAGFTAGAPATLIAGGYYTAAGTLNLGRTYDVSPDGQRFLMIKEGGDDAASTPRNLIVVQHFDEELKRLVPVN